MNSKRRCILHIGTMKTGTTTIQAWLNNHASSLKSQGWTYPGWPMRAASKIANAVEAMPSDNNLIISDEGLWHFSGSALSDTAIIAKILSDFDVTVIAYFRRPDLFLEAWFKQGLKYGSGEHNIIRFLNDRATSAGTFSVIMKRFIRVFGKKKFIAAPSDIPQVACRLTPRFPDFRRWTSVFAPNCVCGRESGRSRAD